MNGYVHIFRKKWCGLPSELRNKPSTGLSLGLDVNTESLAWNISRSCLKAPYATKVHTQISEVQLVEQALGLEEGGHPPPQEEEQPPIVVDSIDDGASVVGPALA